jgi:hypothetical protein
MSLVIDMKRADKIGLQRSPIRRAVLAEDSVPTHFMVEQTITDHSVVVF